MRLSTRAKVRCEMGRTMGHKRKVLRPSPRASPHLRNLNVLSGPCVIANTYVRVRTRPFADTLYIGRVWNQRTPNPVET